jgi:hypothetical protein
MEHSILSGTGRSRPAKAHPVNENPDLRKEEGRKFLWITALRRATGGTRTLNPRFTKIVAGVAENTGSPLAISF